MAIKGAEYAVTRITATLQTYLPAELDLIETEMVADNPLTLADVEAAAYFEYEHQSSLVPFDLSITVNVVSTDPMDIKSTLNSPGVYHAQHRIIVSVHKKDTGNEEPQTMKKRVLRYARGIERVLAIKYPTLTATVVSTQRVDEATYVAEDQGEGQFTRTATIPFLVTTYENL